MDVRGDRWKERWRDRWMKGGRGDIGLHGRK